MEPGLLILLSYVASIALLLLVLLKTPLAWVWKAALIVLFGALYGFHFDRIESMRGWPSAAEPPENFQLLSTQIVEPNESLGIEGAVYLWGIPAGSDQSQPRAFKLPYSPPLHEGAADAESRVADGKVVMVKQRDEELSGSDADDDSVGSRYLFVDAPKRELPPKN